MDAGDGLPVPQVWRRPMHQVWRRNRLPERNRHLRGQSNVPEGLRVPRMPAQAQAGARTVREDGSHIAEGVCSEPKGRNELVSEVDTEVPDLLPQVPVRLLLIW